ncbi:MAG: hypothetical protein CSB16_01550 [Clostridiales bacterium]|nr:MAG: hypothetical protein CSB16_01550 [Clostridiales bacterium]
MKKLILLMVLVLSVVLFFGCSENKTNDEKAIEEVINQNFKYFQDKDWDAYCETIDMSGDSVEDYIKELDGMFSKLDLELSLEKVEIIKIEGDRAEVRVVQITKNKNDQEFKDNKSTVLHRMIKKDGKWLFSDFTVEDTVFIDE